MTKKKKTFSFISLGCPKNLVDSEALCALLLGDGYVMVADGEKADLALINTCGFITEARDEAIAEIERLLALKASGQIGRVAVAGCLIPASGETLRVRFPGVDWWVGPFDEPRLIEMLALSPGSFCHRPQRCLSFFDRRRLRLTVPHTAYLKIAEGCDRFCSYCAIPNIRGRFVSKPLRDILDESRRLADSGVRELVLIAQETTFWGSDRDGRPRLADLLAALKERKDVDWIRVLYAYPTGWDDDLISLFGGENQEGTTRILPYVDLPQHASDRILRAMNRKVGRAETEELLAALRERIPDLTLRTTFIVGFPGETDAEFDELCAFARRWRFERAGVFAYSPEAGTNAALLPGQIPDAIKRRRREQLAAIAQTMVFDFAKKRVGRVFDVLIDAPFCDENGEPVEGVWIGRSAAESPDIDPVVYVNGERPAVGDLVRVEAVVADGGNVVAVAR